MSSNSKMEQPNAKNFYSLKKEVSEISDSVVKYFTDVDGKLVGISKDLKELKKKYNSLNNELEYISNELDEIKVTLKSMDENKSNHDYMNYDIMQKMVASQQAMFETVLYMLEAHSIIDKSEMAMFLFDDSN